MISVSVITG